MMSRTALLSLLILAIQALPVRAAIYSEGFESGAPGFTYSSFWHITPNAPFSGSFALGYVHHETAGPTPNGSFAGSGNNGYFFAFSPLIALPNSSSINFDFDALVHNENSTFFDRLTVGVSLNGTTFDSKLASSSAPTFEPGLPISVNNGYHHYSVSLNGYAGQSVYLAFAFATIDQLFNNFPGPRIDNLLVDSAAAVPEPASLTLWGLGVLGCGFAGYRRRKVA